jgi:ATP-binding protein involved in chromosome partitioning
MRDKPTSEAELRVLLGQVKYPGFPRDIVALGMVTSATVDGHQARITLRLPSGKGTLPPELGNAIRARLEAVGLEAQVVLEDAPSPSPARGPAPTRPGAMAAPASLPGVRAVLAVSSAKGGVGKSTVATNLACAFAQEGLRTGLLDADVYGPSLPIMMGTETKPGAAGGKHFHPVEQHGVKCISVGFFLDDSSPVIWRGPMVTGLLRQFLGDVVWGDLDVLVIDLPPGTGDAQLTLVQQVKFSGAVVVTTPQDVARRDVERGVAMFKQVQVPIIGVIENMSFFACPQCGAKDSIFGSGGGAEVALLASVPLLAQIPLDPQVCEDGDAGRPIVLAAPASATARVLRDLAVQLAKVLGIAAGVPAMASA